MGVKNMESNAEREEARRRRIIESLANLPEHITMPSALGKLGNRWYFGKTFDADTSRQFLILFSDGALERIPLANNGGRTTVTSLGVSFRNFPMAEFCSWSNESISTFCSGGCQILPPHELLNKLKAVCDEYMEFQNLHDSLLLACWVLGTYCYQLFPAYPYLLITGPYGSGKTRLQILIGYLSFNSISASNLTESSLFRFVDSCKGALIIDEYENMGKEKRQAIGQLLNAGYKRDGGFVLRTEGDKNQFRPRRFDTYSPKTISNIDGLNRVTASRTIKVELVPASGNAGGKEVSVNPQFQELRNLCHILIMQQWQDIERQYAALNTVDGVSNRKLELWRPMLAIAKLAGNAYYEQVLEMAKTDAAQEFADRYSEWDYQLLRVLYEKVEDENWQKAETITAWLNNRHIRQVEFTNKWIGRILSQYGFKRRYNPQAEYYLSKDIVAVVIRKLGLPLPFSTETSHS